MPADTCEGVYSRDLWRWVTTNFALEAVVTFDPEATPFPGVDTNPVVVMVRRGTPQASVAWVRVHRDGTSDLLEWVLAGRPWSASLSLTVTRRDTLELLSTGLSRPPRTCVAASTVLGDYARVMRGIATGDNSYFLLTSRRARELGLPERWLRAAVARTRDVPGDTVSPALLEALEEQGRPTKLLCLDGRPVSSFAHAVQVYIEYGERLGLPSRALISQRRPWYRMETREVPPYLFAYLGRRNARFVRNLASALPLTGFLCVYPLSRSPEQVECLWAVLQHPQVVANLALVGKSYGSGAIKVEPRALERLPMPDEVVSAAGIVKAPRLL